MVQRPVLGQIKGKHVIVGAGLSFKEHDLLYREEEREMIPFCQDSGVALVTYSPLAAGRVVRDWSADTERSQTDVIAKAKYDCTEAEDKEIVTRVAEVAERYGVSRSQVALAWLWQKGMHSPILGVTKEAYLDDFMGAFDLALTADDVAYLEEPYKPHQVMGAR